MHKLSLEVYSSRKHWPWGRYWVMGKPGKSLAFWALLTFLLSPSDCKWINKMCQQEQEDFLTDFPLGLLCHTTLLFPLEFPSQSTWFYPGKAPHPLPALGSLEVHPTHTFPGLGPSGFEDDPQDTTYHHPKAQWPLSGRLRCIWASLKPSEVSMPRPGATSSKKPSPAWLKFVFSFLVRQWHQCVPSGLQFSAHFLDPSQELGLHMLTLGLFLRSH